jgi:hypothetical protein
MNEGKELIRTVRRGTDAASTIAMRWTLAVVLAAALFAGCSDSSPGAPSGPPNVSGTWAGDLTIQGSTSRMTWTLSQTGAGVSGPVLVLLPNGIVLLNGTLAGTMAGSVLTYTINVAAGAIPSQPACTGQLGGSATFTAGTPATLAGTYSVVSSSCATPFSSGNFTLTRQ